MPSATNKILFHTLTDANTTSPRRSPCVSRRNSLASTSSAPLSTVRRSSVPATAQSQRFAKTPDKSPDSTPSFTKVSPIHGVRRLGKGSTPSRACYSLLVLIAVGVTTVCFFVLLQDIINNPRLITKMVESRPSLELPKVTVCNLNPLKHSFLADFEEYIDNEEPERREESVFFGNGKECAFCIDGKIDPGLFREKYAKLPSELKSSYGHQISDMILSCSFQGQTCSSEHFTTYVDDFYGNCFSFNSQSVTNSGLESGFVLELSVEYSEYIPYISETIGIRVLLESEKLSSCPSKREVVIPPGVDNSLALKSSFSTGSCSSQYWHLSGGIWPVSAGKACDLITKDESVGSSTVTTNSPGSTATSLPPTLEELEGGSGTEPDENRVILSVSDDFMNSIRKREVSDLAFRATDDNSNNISRDPPLSLTSNSATSQHGTARSSTAAAAHDSNDNDNDNEDDDIIDDNEDVEDDPQSQDASNPSVDEKYWVTTPDVMVPSSNPVDDDVMARFRREAFDEGTDTESVCSSSSTSDAEKVAKARETVAKLRVFYESLREEVEITTPMYPWYVATALLGGQLALFCSLSAVAVIEVIEYALRYIGSGIRSLQPSNKVDARMAW